MLNLEIERDVAVPMRDGVILRADIYRPAGAGQKWPVLLERTPYGKSYLLGVGMPLDPLRAASSGYVVVIQDTRGRFGSDGEFYPFVDEALDGYDTVEWCAEQPWSTGKVGMYGSSYMGATQWQAARESPPHLAALVPNQSSSDYYEGRSYVGGCFELGSCLSTALLALAPNSIDRLGAPRDEAREMVRELRRLVDDLDGTSATLPLDSLQQTALGRGAPYFFDWMHHDTYDEYWNDIAIEPSHASMTRDLPILHLTCWFDSFLKGSLRNYEGMVAAGHANQRLVIGPWTHHIPMAAILGSGRIGEMNAGLGSMIDFDGLQLAWFDRWLKNEGKADGGPPVRLFLMGANRWINCETWPPPFEPTRFYLSSDGSANSRSGDGHLVSSQNSEADFDTFVYDPASPVPTVGGNHVMIATAYVPGSFDQTAVEERDDVLVYTSESLAEDLAVAGYVMLTLSVTSTAPDTDFMARLVDVHPDGSTLNICDGARRLALRESFESPVAYSPGDVAELTFDLCATGHVFRAGNRIRLQVTSSNFPRFARNLNTGEPFYAGSNGVPATQQVLHSSAHASHLTLPVIKS